MTAAKERDAVLTDRWKEHRRQFDTGDLAGLVKSSRAAETRFSDLLEPLRSADRALYDAVYDAGFEMQFAAELLGVARHGAQLSQMIAGRFYQFPGSPDSFWIEGDDD
jgi:hypothetical protein